MGLHQQCLSLPLRMKWEACVPKMRGWIKLGWSCLRHSHSYCFGVHMTFHPDQHCSVVRQRGHFTGAQVQHQKTERKIKQRGFIDDI